MKFERQNRAGVAAGVGSASPMFAVCVLSALVLAGCKAPGADLEAAMRKARAQRPAPIQPLVVTLDALPPITRPVRDPFLRPAGAPVAVGSTTTQGCAGTHLPTQTHERLKYIAPLTRAGHAGAILALPDGRLYHVLVGERVGRACAELRSVTGHHVVFEAQGQVYEVPAVNVPAR